MKLKEIKVGMNVVDKFGNEYVVEEVSRDSSPHNIMPIRLKCTKLLKSVPVQSNDVLFCKVGQTFWIYKSKKRQKNDHMYIVDCITVEELKLKDELK